MTSRGSVPAERAWTRCGWKSSNCGRLLPRQTRTVEVHEGLHGVRDRLGAVSDELLGDALKGSDYIARIGRILGLG